MYLAYMMLATILSFGAAGMAAVNGLGWLSALVVYACSGAVLFFCLAITAHLSDTGQDDRCNKSDTEKNRRSAQRERKSTV